VVFAGFTARTATKKKKMLLITKIHGKRD